MSLNKYIALYPTPRNLITSLRDRQHRTRVRLGLVTSGIWRVFGLRLQ